MHTVFLRICYHAAIAGNGASFYVLSIIGTRYDWRNIYTI